MKAGFFRSASASGMAAPILVVTILALMVLPVPALLLDFFFTFNIAISVIVLLTALRTTRALDFLVFPSVLLISTMLRLSLNVASTRVVLSEGHTGPDAAGKVIEAFGHFLIAGNMLVGVVVFIILTLINFVVITKGAGRIAEVGARFALDAMPGKQMAIDADLNAGLIGEAEAKQRRKEVAQEAEFYGAMDGASKYVKGDAIAGIVITLVNFLGGLAVGMLQRDMSFSSALETFTLLAIGDGLVAQIPALIISTAAGVVVSRVSSEDNTSEQLQAQLLKNTQVLNMTAAIVGSLGLIPGMPTLSFLGLAGLLALLAWTMEKKKAKAMAQAELAPVLERSRATDEASWRDLSPISALGLEVGYRLIGLVDEAQDGELLRRVRGVRKKFAQDVGFLPPPVHIRDNLELRPSQYRLLLKGVEIGTGDTQPGRYLAIDPGMTTGRLPGPETKDPAFGLPAFWINADDREHAMALGYTVVDSATVVATHINHLLGLHAAELFGRSELQSLLEHLSSLGSKLGEELVPKVLSLAVVQRVLQNLLTEGVHIRDLNTIFETLLEHGPQIQDATALTAVVRVQLGRAIVQQICPDQDELPVMALDARLERLLMQSMQNGSVGEVPALEPGLADTLSTQASRAAAAFEQIGQTPVLLVPASLRLALSRFLRRGIPQLRVLSHAELPDNKNIRVTQLVGAAQ